MEGTEGEGDQPSRFLTELGLVVMPRPAALRPLTLAALVGELRRVSVDPDPVRCVTPLRSAGPAGRRDDHGNVVAIGADPARCGECAK